MKLTARSSLATVAYAVGSALEREGVQAVLTGGACATFYTRGAYVSADLDFIVERSAKRDGVDRALNSLGFFRRGDRYLHPSVRFFVEFPRGPLAIGEDVRIRPVSHRGRHGRFSALSPTDCCRDRLAAFYHWNDRQSLTTALMVARRHPIRLGSIRRWSEAEGKGREFQEFVRELERARP